MARLYHYPLSAPARFIRLLCIEKGLDVTLSEERDWDPRREFLMLNPAGEVPVLVWDDGTVFSGSRAIAEYLEEVFSTPNLLGETPEERAETRRLVDWFHSKVGSEVTRHTMTEKLLKPVFGLGEPDSEAVRCAAHNLKTHLRYVEYLTDDQNYLAGHLFSMADAAAAAHLSVEDYFGSIVWDRYPAAKAWYVRVKSRKSMRLILKDRVAPLVPPKHYADPDF